MKNPIVKYCLLVFLLLVPSAWPQHSLKDQYGYALGLYGRGNYFDAVTEFKRLNFFDHQKQFAYPSNMMIAKSYKEGGKLQDALKYCTLAEMSAVNDSDLFNAKIFAVRINILRRTIPGAMRQLDRLLEETRFDARKNEIIYWRGWAYIFDSKWNEAAAAFEAIGNDSLKVFCRNVSSRLYNVTTAKILSYIIPGAGQFYTGHYWSGLLSLGWNALWGYLTVKAFIDERIFDGLIVGNFLWLRFYVGNIRNASKFAETANIEIENTALHYLQYEYRGPKP